MAEGIKLRNLSVRVRRLTDELLASPEVVSADCLTMPLYFLLDFC